MKHPQNFHRLGIDLVENNVSVEAFNRILPNLSEFWGVEAAEFADFGELGNALEGGFGSVEKAIACVKIVKADVGSVGNQVLDDNRAFRQVSHSERDRRDFGGRSRG